MREPIAAPPARPPRFGLLASAAVGDGAPARWQQGFAFQPELCGGGGRVTVACAGTSDTLDSDEQPGTVEGMPFAVYAADECSTFGYNARDWQGRARRALAAIESYEVAAELWTGSLGLQDSNGDPIRSLANVAADTLTTGSAAEPVDALGMIEQALAQCNKGRQGMVHVTASLLTQLVRDNVLRLDGTTWITPNGHIVVPDAGYPGTGPNGEAASTSQWAYGTSMISVLLGPVELNPDSLTDARSWAQALDRAVNSAVVYAQRLAAWQWDECCHVAAKVDLPMPLVGGAS